MTETGWRIPILPMSSFPPGKEMEDCFKRTMTSLERRLVLSLNSHLMPEFRAVAAYWNEDQTDPRWGLRIHLYPHKAPAMYTVYLTWHQAIHLSVEGKAGEIVMDVKRQDWEASMAGKLVKRAKGMWGRIFG